MAKRTGIRTYEIDLIGRMPLIMHADDIEHSDLLKAWQKSPGNKAISVAGDDRSPAWTWLGYLYHDTNVVCIPSDNLMTCVMEGAAMVPVGKGQKTFKAQSQSGMLVFDPYWKLMVDGGNRVVQMKNLDSLRDELDFAVHKAHVVDLGFVLFVKRAKVGQSKHIRVRPYFEKWSATGVLKVWDEQITDEVLVQILECAGKYRGLCDWRPGAPKKPGPFGTFDVVVRRVD